MRQGSWLFFASVTLAGACVINTGCGSDSSLKAGGDGGNAADVTTDGIGMGGSSSGAGGDGASNDGSGGGLSGGGAFGSPDAGSSCLKLGAVCTQPGDCCGGTCTKNVCSFPSCTSDGQSCTSGAQCCGGTCGTGATCTALNTSCKTLGNACTQSTQCCSGLCSGGVCAASSFCGQSGDSCGSGGDCCTGVCTKATGQVYGTCAPPTTGAAANCSMVDGTICGGVASADSGVPACGGACCSRLCAPYGPTGVLVCQPASGCHVVGDLCAKDSDCCGSAGLPGGSGTPVTCDFSGGGPLGVCRNPQGCKPDGDVCKLATMSCNSSCDCCSGNCETKDTCKPDSVGVPRCAGATCVGAGQACASSANCCNGLPCIPNPSGSTPPYVCSPGGGCVAKCGKCTINADCCAGETCIVALGSASGVCGPCAPPSDGGAPDSGQPGPDSGSTTDGASPDSGMPGTDSGSTPNDAGTTTSCSLYGQGCSTNADCCNFVPCSFGLGSCPAGNTGCTCHYPIQ